MAEGRTLVGAATLDRKKNILSSENKGLPLKTQGIQLSYKRIFNYSSININLRISTSSEKHVLPSLLKSQKIQSYHFLLEQVLFTLSPLFLFGIFIFPTSV